MDNLAGEPAGEVRRLRRCISDLVGVLALSAMWPGAEPTRVARDLVEALMRMLDLDLVFVRLASPSGGAPFEMARAAQAPGFVLDPREIGRALDERLGGDPQRWAPLIRLPVEGADLSVAPLRLALRGDEGLVVAGSRRPGFPLETERLLLTVAVNQAAIELQKARSLNEQMEIATRLDREVALRTRELAAANEELTNEVAERKRAEEARRRSEEDLRSTQTKLAHMARLMTVAQLTASIAHEVNQPLSGIVTNANTCLRMLAANPPNVEGARETARRTIRDGNRASEVTKRLRALFGNHKLSLEPVDLTEAVREVLALSRTRLHANRVIARTEFADDLPNVIADRVQLQQVVLNLIYNASDAMSSVDDRARHMAIRIERSSDTLRLTVSDVGVGFAGANPERLFDAFFTTKSDGMGVGLSVSRSIIESHGGRIWAEANEGPGASFVFSVPLSQPVK